MGGQMSSPDSTRECFTQYQNLPESESVMLPTLGTRGEEPRLAR